MGGLGICEVGGDGVVGNFLGLGIGLSQIGGMIPSDLQAMNFPGLASFEEDAHGMIRLAITSSKANAQIYLHGAHVVHFQPIGLAPVLFLSEDGVATWVKPSVEYTVLGKNELTGRTFATPSFYQDAMFLRTDEHLLKISQQKN